MMHFLYAQTEIIHTRANNPKTRDEEAKFGEKE